MFPSSCAAIEAIGRFAKSRPESPALIDPDGAILDYEELWAQILAVGSRLQEAGVGPRETVAILLPQGRLQVLAVAGTLHHGTCAPLQPRTTVDDVSVLLEKLGATALIVSLEFESETQAAIEMGLTVLIADRSKPPGEWEVRPPASPSPGRTAVADAVLLLITSATTGSSKIVPLTSVNLDAQTEPRARILGLKESDRLLQMTSLGHSMAIENTLAQFLAGGAVIATGGFDPTEYLRWLSELGPTWYDCSPTVHQAALAQLKRTPLDRSISIRFVQSAGAPLPSEVRQELEQILSVPVLNDYGMTETGPIATDAFLPYERIPNSAGRSCGLEISIVGALGEALQTDEEGEIAVRGPAVFSAYAGNSESTRAAFRNGWFLTGDAGRLDAEGNLFISGRLKEMFNRGGEKFSPSDVDAVLLAHPAVLDAAAFAVPHPTLGEDVACAVVLRTSSEQPVTSIELRRFAAERLATFKVPHRVHFVDEIPRGELGKPKRWLLTERLGGERAAPPSPAELTRIKTDEVLGRVYDIWVSVLDRDDLGVDEDFFEAGGDSLAAIHMLAEVDQRLGSETSALAASFLDEPTLGHLVDLIHAGPRLRPGKTGSNEICAFPIREEGAKQRLFCIPGDGDEGLYFRRLAKRLSGQIDLIIVRPENTWYKRSLFTFERNGAATARIIRELQPEGPYFVGGYCYGGVVAVETARQLSLEGNDARLILFDVPMPGYPPLLRGWRNWIKRAWIESRMLRDGSKPRIVKDLLRFASHLVWSTAASARRFLIPVERIPGVSKLLYQFEKNYFPLYRPRPIQVPILHFLSIDEPHMILGISRFGWRGMARHGIDEESIPLDHLNLFHESNLPNIVSILRRWTGNSQSDDQDRADDDNLTLSHFNTSASNAR